SRRLTGAVRGPAGLLRGETGIARLVAHRIAANPANAIVREAVSVGGARRAVAGFDDVYGTLAITRGGRADHERGRGRRNRETEPANVVERNVRDDPPCVIVAAYEWVDGSLEVFIEI